MALLAGGMIFTSCTKNYTITVASNNEAWGTVQGGGLYADQTEITLTAVPAVGYEFEKWQDGNTDNPRTIVVTADETYTAYFKLGNREVKVTFNTDKWDAGSVQGAYYSANTAWDVYAEAEAESYPKADVAMFTGTATGSYSDVVDPESAFLSSRGSEFGWVDYYYDSYLYDGDNNVYGDWWAKSATVNVTAFDATAMMISADVTATVFDAAEALIDGAGIDGAHSSALGVTISNINLSTAKSSLNKKLNGKLSVAR